MGIESNRERMRNFLRDTVVMTTFFAKKMICLKTKVGVNDVQGVGQVEVQEVGRNEVQEFGQDEVQEVANPDVGHFDFYVVGQDEV